MMSNVRAAQENELALLESKMLRRARLQRFFEQSQQTCHGYLRALLPRLHERIGLALELPTPLELRNAGAVTKERKYELWNQLKLSCTLLVVVTALAIVVSSS